MNGKNIVFFCDTYGRAALISALTFLGTIQPDKTSLKEVIQLPWWRTMNNLPPGQLLEIGFGRKESRIFVIWLPGDKELLPRLAHSMSAAFSKNPEWLFIDALPRTNHWTGLARKLSLLMGNSLITHCLFLLGILKENRQNNKAKVAPRYSR